MVRLVIWDVIAPICRHCNVLGSGVGVAMECATEVALECVVNMQINTAITLACFVKSTYDVIAYVIKIAVHYITHSNLSTPYGTMELRHHWFRECLVAYLAPSSPATVEDCIEQLTHWGRHKIDAILQTTFSNAISWMKMYEFLLKFH